MSFWGLFLAFSVNAQSRISITWEVTKYEIVASLPQDFSSDRNLGVVATLRLRNVGNRAFSRLTLRISDQAEISSVMVNGVTADFRRSEESIGGNRKLQRAIVGLSPIAPNASFSVKVNYKLKVQTNSGLNALSPVGSQFLPLSFWYPTPNSWFFAGGSDFAPYSLRVNNASGLTVVSSGNYSGNVSDQLLSGQPFFSTGQWEIVEANGVMVFAPKGSGANGTERANELSGFLSEMKVFVSELSGKEFAFPMRIVSVDRGAGFSDGGTVFVDDSVFRRQKIDSQTAMILGEAVAKMWLGNIVEVQGDGYGVIREGLSKYIATQFLEKKFGKAVADIERLRQRTSYAAIARRDSPLSVVSPIDGYYYSATANKGAIIWKFLSFNFKETLFESIRQLSGDGYLNLLEVRQAFSKQKQYIDYMLDKNTTMNLMAGIPQYQGNQTKVALRNIGEVAANVDVTGTTATGQKLVLKVTIPSNGFSEAVFRSGDKVVKAEIDVEKIYPQTDYVDDVSPRDISENDPISFY